MLELGQLVGPIGELALETKRRHEIFSGQLSHALSQALLAADDWESQRSRIESAKTSWLVAVPIDGNPINSAINPPASLSPYTIIATDGSQIPLDRHGAAPCYVLNVGEVVMHYGTGERPHLYSNAELLYKDDDVLARGDGAEASYINERTLGTRRMVAEFRSMKKLIAKHTTRESVLCLIDGTLILWAQEAEGDEEEKRAIGEFMALLNEARDASAPVAGYLSRPGSREVVNALRVTLCPDTPVQCKPCRHTPAPCDALNRLTDAQLYRTILATGQRSGLFESQSRVIDAYSPVENRIAFYYLNVGAEIARVEMPMWVAKDNSLLDRTHALILSQAAKGHGYPSALLEAHEQAVVRASERESFQQLVENSLVRHSLPVTQSRKAIAKRIPTL